MCSPECVHELSLRTNGNYLRNCVYIDEFYKRKIIYPDISQKLSFSILEENYFAG